MQKILRLLNKEINGLHQTAFLLAMASVGAKILAIFRDRLLAGSFGAGKALDIYYASFRLPDLLYVISLFLVSVTALIPLIIKKREFGHKEARDFINSVFTVFFIAMILLVVVSYFATPYISVLIAPGFSDEDSKLLINFSRVLLFSPLLLGLSNIVASVVQTHKRFLVYALSGVLYNAGIVFGLIFFYPRFGFSGVIWGVVLGALLHLSIQIPTLIKLGYMPRLMFKIPFEEIKNVIKLSLPRALGLTLNQLVLIMITALASFLSVGSIAVFNLSSNLQTIPLGIFALSYSVAAFPSLARSFIKRDRYKFISSVTSAFRHIVFWLVPLAVLFIVLRAQIIRVVLGTGAFNWTDTRLTAAAFALFSVSLFAQGLILLFVRAFYAAGKTKIPLAINAISSAFIIILSLFFMYIFDKVSSFQAMFENILRVEEVGGSAVLVFPLAYSLGTVLNFFLLFIFFERNFGSLSKHVEKSMWQVSVVSAIIGGVSYFLLSVFDNVFNINTFVGIFMQGFLSGILALAVGFFILKYLKNKELNELLTSFKNKFQKKSPVKPEPEKMP